MSGDALIAYLGLGSAYAACVCTLLWAGLTALRGPRVAARDAVALLPAVLFLVLTQHPFPDRETLDCSDGGVAPILQPFAVTAFFVDLIEQGAGLRAWLGNKMVQQTGFNFALCVAAGIGLTRFLRTPGQAALAGFGLSLLAETAQITGLFGIYPCAYRTFEVDDLILNTAGVLCGHALVIFSRPRATDAG